MSASMVWLGCLSDQYGIVKVACLSVWYGYGGLYDQYVMVKVA